MPCNNGINDIWLGNKIEVTSAAAAALRFFSAFRIWSNVQWCDMWWVKVLRKGVAFWAAVLCILTKKEQGEKRGGGFCEWKRAKML